MKDDDWDTEQRLALLYSSHADQKDDSPVCEAVAILFNAAAEDVEFSLPDGLPPDWTMRFCSSPSTRSLGSARFLLAGRSLLLITSALDG
jgi:hypothetical protein